MMSSKCLDLFYFFGEKISVVYSLIVFMLVSCSVSRKFRFVMCD